MCGAKLHRPGGTDMPKNKNENIEKFKEDIYNDKLDYMDIECNDERLGYAMGRVFATSIIACKAKTPDPTKLLHTGEHTIGRYKQTIVGAWKHRNYCLPMHVKWLDKLLGFMIENSMGREKEKMSSEGEDGIMYGLIDIHNEKTTKLIGQSLRL